MAGGMAAANDGTPDVAETSYLNAQYQGDYAAPQMRSISFPMSSGAMTGGTVGAHGFDGPYCEAGYWHDLYPTNCYNYHHMWLWDNYCTHGWHGWGGWGGHGCSDCGSHCGGDCASAAPEHEHVDVAPAVIDPAESDESSNEGSSEPSADELEPPREEPEVKVPPTKKLEETKLEGDDSANEAYEAEDFRAAEPAPITSEASPEPREIDFTPIENESDADLENFDGLDE
jgi:hypothetical protein